MEHLISRETTTNLWFFSTSGTGNALNYISLMHQIRCIITVAQLHICPRVLLDVRGIVRLLEVFVQLLGLKLALQFFYFGFFIALGTAFPRDL